MLFFKKEGWLIEHIVLDKGIAEDDTNIQIMEEWPTPVDKLEVFWDCALIIDDFCRQWKTAD